MYDLLIVGQGLAGINLSYQAEKAGLSCFHWHKSIIGESTKVAAGLINPITGRRFVTSWRINEVMPFAKEHYEELGKKFQSDYISLLNIVRVFKNYADENTWLAKSSDHYLKQFVLDSILWDRSEVESRLNLSEILGELQNCFKIDLINLQLDYIKHLKKNNLITEAYFDIEKLEIHKDHVLYDGISAKDIVFCEGWQVMNNPLFNDIEFAPAKGELFIIHAPLLKLKKAYKKDMFITPLGEDKYWVGATYEWQNFDPTISEKMKTRLLESLNNMIKVPYTILSHLSGIRPSSKDRRPILGPHITFNNVFLFNGMGTKGSSLSPFFAKQLIDHIIYKFPIEESVHIDRYYK